MAYTQRCASRVLMHLDLLAVLSVKTCSAGTPFLRCPSGMWGYGPLGLSKSTGDKNSAPIGSSATRLQTEASTAAVDTFKL